MLVSLATERNAWLCSQGIPQYSSAMFFPYFNVFVNSLLAGKIRMMAALQSRYINHVPDYDRQNLLAFTKYLGLISQSRLGRLHANLSLVNNLSTLPSVRAIYFFHLKTEKL